MTLNDAYNELLSGEVDSWDAFADAYLVLKGCEADSEDLRAMKENRVLILDADADAQYLTKSVSDTQVENMLTNINDQIHKVALSPDFNDEKFMASSGIAIKYKLMGMENNASAIESNMRKALQKRIELISTILNLKGDDVWRDVNIVFTRNLPENTVEIANMVNSLRGLVSDYTLLGLLPFIDNVDKEMERVKEQKESEMELYQFGDTNGEG
jgi:SPP1 family phage portal protein